MRKNKLVIRLLYGTGLGRKLVKFILKKDIDKGIVKFLCSPFSKFLIPMYIKKHKVSMEDFEGETYRTFQEFFARERKPVPIDLEPTHLISPCDGWMSKFPIREDSSFYIKGARYKLKDLIKSNSLAKAFHGGECLIFRLESSDYHHYCYIDDGTQGENYYIPGELHSVQREACEKSPIYALNRRVWSILTTENFGTVVQVEIGSFLVGGIKNEIENGYFSRGMEKGHFELSGSTIVLLFQKDTIRLLPQIRKQLAAGDEIQVKQGMWIGEKK